MNVVDIFAGIGGISLGLERTGMKTIAFCEIGRMQQKVLRKHWSDVPIFPDATKVEEIYEKLKDKQIDLIAGGDPCPIRSRAKGARKTKHPDLSGYFLALVGLVRPRWVLRENVPAPDNRDFTAALELLGYRTVIIRSNAAAYTAQNRTRDFIVGCNSVREFQCFYFLLVRKSGKRVSTPGLKNKAWYPCLTTRRYDPRNGLIWDHKRRQLRIADKEERRRLSGFPPGWTDGLSETTCARLYGNTVVPAQVEEIGRLIMESEKKGGLDVRL